MSDDPIAGGEVLRTSSSLRAIGQFRRNIDQGLGRANLENSVLAKLTDTLTRGVELAVQGANGTMDAGSRQALKSEVDQLLVFSVQLGNMKFGNSYLFGGDRAGEAPFTSPPPAIGTFSALVDTTGTSVNPSGGVSLEIGDGNFLTPTHNGSEVFLNTDALDSLRALSRALGADDANAVRTAMDRVRDANDAVQRLIGTNGARVNEMEAAQLAMRDQELNAKAYLSDLRDTPIDEAIAELTGKQTLYQAAMGATARVLGLSLANYL
jgi:flagellar hook-associated protein 3 FlgL